MSDIRLFLRFLSDDELTTLRDSVKAALLSNTRFTTVSINGKSGVQDQHVPVAALAEALPEILEERGLTPEGYTSTPKMGVARFV
jgi:hypothetical protein